MYTLIVNEKSAKGKSLLEYAKKLDAADKDVRIRKFRKVTDEEMALPGKPVSEEQFDEWNNRSDAGKTITADKLKQLLDKKFNTKRTPK